MAEWFPIASAPLGPMDVLVYCDDTREQFVAFRSHDGRYQFSAHEGTRICCKPSHWMPLPEPPK